MIIRVYILIFICIYCMCLFAQIAAGFLLPALAVVRSAVVPPAVRLTMTNFPRLFFCFIFLIFCGFGKPIENSVLCFHGAAVLLVSYVSNPVSLLVIYLLHKYQFFLSPSLFTFICSPFYLFIRLFTIKNIFFTEFLFHSPRNAVTAPCNCRPCNLHISLHLNKTN